MAFFDTTWYVSSIAYAAVTARPQNTAVLASAQQLSFKFSGAELIDPANTPVFVLYLVTCPPHVTRSVRTIIINSVKCHSKWSFSEIGKNVFDKSDEVSPRIADIDATSTVVFIIFAVWIGASLDYVTPNVIDGGLFSSSSIAMAIIAFVAAARTNSSIFLGCKAPSFDSVKISAVTSAEPLPTISSFRNSFERCQATKFLISQFQRLHRHRAAPIGSSEVAGLVLQVPIPLRTLTSAVGGS